MKTRLAKGLWYIAALVLVLAVIFREDIVGCLDPEPTDPPSPQIIELKVKEWQVNTNVQDVLITGSDFTIEQEGRYALNARLLYSAAADSQLIESCFFRIVKWEASKIIYPINPNHISKWFIVHDNNSNMNEEWVLRSAGVWELARGDYSIAVDHLSLLDDSIEGIQSVHGDYFSLRLIQ